ncbi:hypothetical protein ARMGADRAFT_1032588 [Armillaria gallica]|uniref:Uncharacterized protein n=1 Tax=Armillaria gallica TaxID=47427 RepID=A0A2H3DGL0_ARMGA|nr:hypothetical protein ARMGADRAFT_1032588 [Armillaria gallica]
MTTLYPCSSNELAHHTSLLRSAPESTLNGSGHPMNRHITSPTEWFVKGRKGLGGDTRYQGKGGSRNAFEHWTLMMEEVTQSPNRLAEERQKIAINDGDFLISRIGDPKYL